MDAWMVTSNYTYEENFQIKSLFKPPLTFCYKEEHLPYDAYLWPYKGPSFIR